MFLDWKNRYCEIILPKTIYRFNAIPIKLLMAFSTKLEQKISQFVWKHKRSQVAKEILKKKSRAGGIRLPISDYTTKLQSSRQFGIGTKKEIKISGTGQKAQR